MTANNMQIWDAVSKTDPAFTKKVNQRGGFTAIAAHSQIMAATKQFGPVGIGWGYECGEPIFAGPMVMVPVTLWHGERGNSFGPIYGCAEMLGNRPDHDAPKKAMTDAITKGLSQIGFNADVFLGLFDDNKYVETVRQEFAANDSPPAKRAEKWEGAYSGKSALHKGLIQVERNIRGCGDSDELEAYLATQEYKDFFWSCEKYSPHYLTGGDPAPPEFVGINDLIAKMRADFELIENSTLRAG